MIDVKDAAKKAIAYFNDLYEGTGYQSIALEELELSSDETFWLITIGYNEPGFGVGAGVEISGGGFLGGTLRKYKIFEVDAKSGDVISMKMRIL